MIIGPYSPQKEQASVYCMAGDEPLMFSPLASLSDKELEHWRMMRLAILPYAMSVIPMARPFDTVVLDERFLDFSSFFDAHIQLYNRTGLPICKNIFFAKTDDLYATAMKKSRDDGIVSSVCFSYELHRHFPIENEISISKKANSKEHFVKLSEEYGFSTPKTFVFSKKEIADRRFSFSGNFADDTFFVKSDGLGGGYNVKKVHSPEELSSFVEGYGEDRKFILQEIIDASSFDEYAIDFIVKEKSYEPFNLRKKLVYNNQWFGNVYLEDASLTPSQEENLNKCMQSLQDLGYRSKWGNVCSIDFFQNAEKQYITEANGRWSGGFPIAALLKRMNLEGKARVVSFIDKISQEEQKKYIDFVSKYLVSTEDDFENIDFKLLSISFCPAAQDGSLYVWLLVFGNYQNFWKLTREIFSRESFETAPIVASTLAIQEEGRF